jgi:cytosine/uracil/thiamine/allantoin permease
VKNLSFPSTLNLLVSDHILNINTHQTLRAKEKFKRICCNYSVVVQSYLSVNGSVFTSPAFAKHLQKFEQVCAMQVLLVLTSIITVLQSKASRPLWPLLGQLCCTPQFTGLNLLMPHYGPWLRPTSYAV